MDMLYSRISRMRFNLFIVQSFCIYIYNRNNHDDYRFYMSNFMLSFLRIQIVNMFLLILKWNRSSVRYVSLPMRKMWENSLLICRKNGRRTYKCFIYKYNTFKRSKSWKWKIATFNLRNEMNDTLLLELIHIPCLINYIGFLFYTIFPSLI